MSHKHIYKYKYFLSFILSLLSKWYCQEKTHSPLLPLPLQKTHFVGFFFPPQLSQVSNYPANALVNTTVAAESTKGKLIFAMVSTYC